MLQMAVIFALSSVSSLGTLPGRNTDKVGHFIGYALLGGLMLRALAGARWRGVSSRHALAAWVLSAAYGASDEFHQRFVPGRDAGLPDWIADALGAAAAVLIIRALASSRRFDDREV